jgi:hypothetical protein
VESDTESRVLAVRIKFRAGLGRCTLRAKWLNIKRNSESWKGVTFPTVPYLLPQLVEPYRSEVRSALDDLVENGARTIGDGIYLVRDTLKPDVERRMHYLRNHLLKRAQREVGDLAGLRNDFEKRFLEVLQEFANKEKLDLPSGGQEQACAAALKQFDEYMKGSPFDLQYAFFLPLPGGYDEELSKAVDELQTQSVQVSLFGT